MINSLKKPSGILFLFIDSRKTKTQPMEQITVRTLFVEDIGTVSLRKSKRSHSIRIRVSPKEGITVFVPSFVSENMVLRFIHEKKNWIQKSLKRQARLHQQKTLFTEKTEFKTRWHILYILKHDKNTIRSVVSGDKIVVWYPSTAEVDDQRIQHVIRKAILEAWRVEAKKILPNRVAELARQNHFTYNKLTVKNTKTRWGSCSATNNINLNLQLMRLPDHLINYVILHELTHTVCKNHQKSFWNKMESILPGVRKLDKELNNYHLEYW